MKYLSLFLLFFLTQAALSQEQSADKTTMAYANKWEKSKSIKTIDINILDSKDYHWLYPENKERLEMPFYKSNFNPKAVSFYIASNLDLTMNWRVAKHAWVSHYEIERYNKDQRFEHLKAIASDKKAHRLEPYAFNDEAPLRGISNYRIVQVMQTGERKYSPIYGIKYDRPIDNIVLVTTPDSDFLDVVVTQDDQPISFFFFNEEDQIIGKYAVKKRDKINISSWQSGRVRYDILAKGYEAHGVILVD